MSHATTTMGSPEAFELEKTSLRPKRNGRRGLLIEASAGTGKTYTLERIVEHVLSEERFALEPKHLLVVTFTRAATAELRQRLRRTLVKSADESTGARAERARTAASRFDEATIVTIDGLWNLILNDYALSVGDGAGVEICPDEAEVRREAMRQAAETVLARLKDEGAPALSAETEQRLFDGSFKARLDALAEHPELVLPVPKVEVTDDPARLEAAVVYEVLLEARSIFDAIMRRNGWVTYGEARRRVVRAVRRKALRDALRKRFRCVLIDEFQDTDRDQLAVFRALFLDAPAVGADDSEDAAQDPIVIFVGDPKQAIYRFRGADIEAYLEARAIMAAHASLPKNWRSAPALVEALNILFDTAGAVEALGITLPAAGQLPFFSPVRPMDDAESTAHTLVDDKGAVAPVRVFVGQKNVKKEAVHRRMTAEIVKLLHTARLPLASDVEETRPLHPGDIAVLVRSNAEAKLAAKVLESAGLPVSAATEESIFTRPEALEMLEILRALNVPEDFRRFSAAALGPVGGLTPAELAAVPSHEQGEAQETLAALERRRAFADALREASARIKRSSDDLHAVLTALFEARELKTRLLRKPEGAQKIAVFEKLALRLQAFCRVGGLEGCIALLEEHIREALAASDNDPVAPEDAVPVVDEGGRVRVMTMHKSKGLEFTVVFLPFAELPEREVKLSSLKPTRLAFEMVKTDPERAALFLGGLDPSPEDSDDAEILAQVIEDESREQFSEELRLLYVALTRAKSHLVLFTEAFDKMNDSTEGSEKKQKRFALDMLLAGSTGDGASDGSTMLERAIGIADGVLAQKSKKLREASEAFGQPVLDVVELQAEDFPETVPEFSAPRPMLDDLSALEGLKRPVARAIRRSSFTALAAANPAPSPEGEAGTSDVPEGSEVLEAPQVPQEETPDADEGFEVGADPDAPVLKTDEFDDPSVDSVETDGEADASSTADGESDAERKKMLPLPLRLPRGANPGTAMHELYEWVDFVTGEVQGASTLEEAAERAFRRAMGKVDAETVSLAADIVRTTLAVRFGAHEGEAFVLSDIKRSARRSEMPFAIRVAENVTARVLNAALSAYDPTYRFTTDEGASRFDLGGFLTGSIDLAFTHDGKWWLADWKSNVVVDGPDALPVTAEAISHEMRSHRYHLQYLLYLVAYRRWLRSRWRAAGLKASAIEACLESTYGGVYYVFFRWLGSDQSPQASGSPAGLFYARPSGTFLDALDDLLDGRLAFEGGEAERLDAVREHFAALRSSRNAAHTETNA